jgi:hypothetical protein
MDHVQFDAKSIVIETYSWIEVLDSERTISPTVKGTHLAHGHANCLEHLRKDLAKNGKENFNPFLIHPEIQALAKTFLISSRTQRKLRTRGDKGQPGKARMIETWTLTSQQNMGWEIKFGMIAASGWSNFRQLI